MRLISSVRSGAPGNPNRKKKKNWDFTPLLIALKYFSSLVFSQLCAAGDGCKNLRHIFIYKPILLEKNKTKQNKTKLNSSSATLCDPWVFSSRLELAVVFGVIFRSGLHYIFVSVWKSKKKWFWSKTLPLSILNHFRVVYINRMDQQICFVRFARG